MVISLKDSFIVGVDIIEFIDLFVGLEEDLVVNNLNVNEIFNVVEDLLFLIVIVINGMVLGGGFEMCLVIDYWVMDKKVKVGLLEVKLGIFLGFGGIVCLFCLVGVDNVVEWISGGIENCVDVVLKVGVVDVVVEFDKLIDVVVVIIN